MKKLNHNNGNNGNGNGRDVDVERPSACGVSVMVHLTCMAGRSHESCTSLASFTGTTSSRRPRSSLR